MSGRPPGLGLERLPEAQPEPSPALLLELWIAGRVPAPNTIWRHTPVKPRKFGPSRHSEIADLREKAQVVALVSARTRTQPIRPPVHMIFRVFRRRLLDSDSAVFALKAYRDGILQQLLPGSSDAPKSGNQFTYRPQVQVQTDHEEGVLVQIYAASALSAHERAQAAADTERARRLASR